MKTNLMILGVLFTMFCLNWGVASADVLRVAPSQAVVLPSAGDGWTRVALQFDLSGMRSGTGRTVAWAYLEWAIDGGGTSDKEFFAYPVTTSWVASQVATRLDLITYSSTPASTWSLTTDEQERLGCTVRLNLKSLVTDWLGGVSSNYGVAFATREVSGTTLNTQLANARLVVGYGFHGNN